MGQFFTFLKNGVGFATLEGFRNFFEINDKFQFPIIGFAWISAPSLYNVPERLSMPAAFEMFTLS